MNYSYQLNNGILSVVLEGRFDTNFALQFETEVMQISKENPHDAFIFDASNLEYIASSGLRIMLKMFKTEKNFKIENVSPAVYSVFEVTGFSKIIPMTKALRKIDLDKCEKIGAGGNGAVYRLSEDEIVKVNYNPDTYEGLDKELAKAKEAFLLGIPTAISFDLVECGGGKKGVVYEAIKSSTLGEAIQKDPSRMEELTERYIEQLNLLHSVHTDNPVFGSAKASFAKQVEDASKYLTEEEGELMKQILEALPVVFIEILVFSYLSAANKHGVGQALVVYSVCAVNVTGVGITNGVINFEQTRQMVIGLRKNTGFDCFINLFSLVSGAALFILKFDAIPINTCKHGTQCGRHRMGRVNAAHAVLDTADICQMASPVASINFLALM